MKKIILLAAFAVSTLASGAEGLNIGVNFGYGIGAATSNMGTNSTSSSDENVKGTFGEGLNLGLNLNYMFNDNLGADLGFGYLSGKEFSNDFNSGSGISGNDKMSATMIRIMPGVRVSAGDGKTVEPYGRFGLVLGVGSKMDMTSSMSGLGNSLVSEYEYSEGSSFGWYGAFGVGFGISDKLKLTTELTMINQTWAPEKKVNTSNSDGSALDPVITYDDKVNDSDTNKDLKYYLPFGSLGLNVGLQMSF
jgi:opacity protein-like surface antigen